MPKPKKLVTDEQIDALHEQIYGGNNDAPAEAAEGEAASQGEAAASQEANAAGAPAAPAPEASGGDAPIDYEQRYNSLQGKYDAELPRLQQELKNTQDMLAAHAQGATIPEFDTSGALTAEEIDEYGEELIDIVKRAARAEFAPVLNQLSQQNKDLQEKMQATAKTIQLSSRDQMLEHIGQAIPNWAEVNQDQAFLDWLAQPDLLSGVPRQQLLTNAFERNDTNRVIAFFKGFLNPEQTGQAPPVQPSGEAPPRNGMETLLAPNRPAGTAATGAQPSGRIWTTAEVQQLAKDRLKGAISREDADKLDVEIHRAAMEGRLQ